jgi:hypothetical protein
MIHQSLTQCPNSVRSRWRIGAELLEWQAFLASSPQLLISLLNHPDPRRLDIFISIQAGDQSFRQPRAFFGREFEGSSFELFKGHAHRFRPL